MLMLSDAAVGCVFRFKEQWYSQFVFVKISETELLNWDLDRTSPNYNNPMEIEFVNLNDFVKGDPERIKRYLSRLTASPSGAIL